MADITDNFIGLSLSAAEVSGVTGWPDAMVDAFVSLVDDLTTTANSVDANYMAVGSGSPEGVSTSNKSRQYFDSSAGRLYVNAIVGADTGWAAIN